MRGCLLAGIAWVLLGCLCATGQPQFAYRIDFTDKNNTTYTLSSPGSYLSARALTRRSAQGIAVDSTDIPVNHTYVDSILNVTGGVFHESSKWKNLMVVLVTDSTGLNATLSGIAFVKNVQLVGYYGGTGLHHKGRNTKPAYSRTTSDATYYSQTWGQTQIVNGNVLHDEGHRGAGKMIAVLDAGFIDLDTCPYGFDSLRNSGRIVDVHNFSYGSEDVYAYDNHGTMVLSTMACYVPDTFVGSAPMAMYDLYVTEVDPTEQPLELINLLCGAERADSVGADIITCSLGYNTFDNPVYNFNFSTDLDGKSTVAAQAANMATQKGILFVASAGNEGGDAWNMILTPGDADSALTIGSVKPDGTMAASSGYGPNAAGNIKPDVCGQGQPSNVVDGYEYASADGTSFATPEIAGWAACLWEAHPTATPNVLRRAIDSCASIHWAPENHYGYGIANFNCSDFLLKVNSPVYPKDKIVAGPNPCGDLLNVRYYFDGTGTLEMRLTDMWGREVLSTRTAITGAVSEIALNTSGIAPGVYVLQARTESTEHIVRVVKY
jgi:serine protease AprX